MSQDFDDITKVSGVVKNGLYTTDENIKKLAKEAIEDYGKGWLLPEPELGEPVQKTAKQIYLDTHL